MKKEVKRIYEVVADKTLSLGCGVFIQNYITSVIIVGDNRGLCMIEGMEYTEFLGQTGTSTQAFGLKHVKKIIGHDVMIGTMIDWINENGHHIFYTSRHGIYKDLIYKWKLPKLPIESQSKECQKFILELIEKYEK